MNRKEAMVLLQKYVNQFNMSDDYERLLNLLEIIGSDSITIANTGVVSSGKSSLFNVLLNRFDEDKYRFPIGSARTTIAKDAEELINGVVLVDTPGIDVNEKDNETALLALKASSIVMIIHNVRMGEITRNEAEWYSSIKKFYKNSEEIKDRVVLVLSWIEDKIDAPNYQSIVENLKKEVFEVFDTEIDTHMVSAKLYIEGKKQAANELVELSGVEKLRQDLFVKVENYKKKYGSEAMVKEQEAILEKFVEKLSQYREKLMSEQEAIIDEVNSDYDLKNAEWKKKHKKFKQYYLDVKEEGINGLFGGFV